MSAQFQFSYVALYAPLQLHGSRKYNISPAAEVFFTISLTINILLIAHADMYPLTDER